MLALMLKKSGAERLLMGFSMFDAAKHLVEASIAAKSGNTKGPNFKKAVFLRFYGNDFSPEVREKIFRFWSDPSKKA